METTEYTCECSEDYGPCEQHSEMIVSRDGSSSRTADELLAVFIDDVEGLRDDIRPWDAAMQDAVETAAAYWDACPSGGWAPLPDDDEDSYPLSEALADAIPAAEYILSRMGLWVNWDDGFVIYQITGGPLFDGSEQPAAGPKTFKDLRIGERFVFDRGVESGLLIDMGQPGSIVYTKMLPNQYRYESGNDYVTVGSTDAKVWSVSFAEDVVR